MKLNDIKIENFRCFKDYTVSFAPGCTVLFGKNGAGKSCLIQAIRNLCSFIFSSESTFEGHFIATGIPDLKIKNFISSDFHFDDYTRKIADYASLKGTATFHNHELSWELRRTSKDKGRLQYSLYKDAYLRFADCVENGADYPLLVYFSDSFPHRKSKIDDKILPYTGAPTIPRGVGYYQWTYEASCTSFWEARLCNMFNLTLGFINEPDGDNAITDPAYKELKYVSDTLIAFSKKLPGNFVIKTITSSLESNSWHLNFRFGNTRSQILQRLPAGYRRLFSIVLEIASRWYILNENTNQPHGIVIIDEIDLHLHPELEQTIIAALTSTFPDIQFIFSTHSPLVITNINSNDGQNVIYKMTDDTIGPIQLRDIYGLDYDSGVSEAMDVEPRTSDIANLIETYLLLEEENEQELMNEILRHLNTLTGNEKESLRLIHKAKEE